MIVTVGFALAEATTAAAKANPDTYFIGVDQFQGCLLYTSDAADERSSVDLGGRRIINKKTTTHITARPVPSCKAYNREHH